MAAYRITSGWAASQQHTIKHDTGMRFVLGPYRHNMTFPFAGNPNDKDPRT